MQLKRIYDNPDGWQREYEGLAAFAALLEQSGLSPEQREAQAEVFRRTARVSNCGPQKGLEVIDTGVRPEQNWSRDFVEAGLKGGWVSVGQSVLTVHTVGQGDFPFRILRVPGTYCCHCEAQLEDDPSGRAGLAHVQQQHPDTPSPDPQNPHGFRVTPAYECVLEEAVHARWNFQAVQDAKTQAATVKPADAEIDTPRTAPAPASPPPERPTAPAAD